MSFLIKKIAEQVNYRIIAFYESNLFVYIKRSYKTGLNILPLDKFVPQTKSLKEIFSRNLFISVPIF